MVQQEVIVRNESGLHARPAKSFVTVAKKFESKISILKDGKEFNAKSMVMVMSACLVKGSVFQIAAQGPDEGAALRALTDAVESGLGE